ncbi:Uncharacterised protein g1892 [Pycnogonum litorale]
MIEENSSSHGTEKTTTDDNKDEHKRRKDELKNKRTNNSRLSSTRTTSLQEKLTQDAKTTLMQHYYPEGGYGWIICFCVFLVNFLTTGLQLAYGNVMIEIVANFNASLVQAAWLGAVTIGSSLLLAPLVVAICRQRSIRITSIIGGLVFSLGCLFSSFATHYHQALVSFGFLLGVGISLVRETADLMIGQYFKRRRELVEVLTNSGSGIGLIFYSFVFKAAIRSIKWRLGLQAMTGVMFATFLVGVCYRSASLYHPQRRAIQHLKNQRRKVKEKVTHKTTEKQKFFDLDILKIKCLRVLMICCAFSYLGILSPVIFLITILREEGMDEDSIDLLKSFLGVSMVVGYAIFGLMVIRESPHCHVSRHYLAQSCLLCLGLSLIAFSTLQGYHGYVLCVFMYGIFFSGYTYCVKLHLYEKVRARNFSKAWAFLQGSIGIPSFLGIGINAHIMSSYGAKCGLYFCSTCIFCSVILHFVLTSLQKKNVNGYACADGTVHFANENVNHYRPAVVDNKAQSTDKQRCKCNDPNSGYKTNDSAAIDSAGCHKSFAVNNVDIFDETSIRRPEYLTCISEEGGLVDNYLLEDLYQDNCITSCNKVEKYLMMSEFENNARIPSSPPLRNVDSTESKPETDVRRDSDDLTTV